MGASVAAVVSTFPDLEPGDSYLLNSPYAGGTHLPDLTVVTPVFDESQRTLTAFVASRAHHADIGGVTPGSMPPWSRTIDDEGTLLEPMRIVHDGILDEPTLRARLGAGPHPARDPERNLADLRAQLAANARGMRELRRARSEFGSDVVAAFMTHVQDNAERCMRRAIGNLRNGEFRYELDNGQAIAVRIAVDAASGSAIVDFDSMPAACVRSRSAFRTAACSTPPGRAPSWPATSRLRSASSMPCMERSVCRLPRRVR
jgi:5-oxoprolinase (ATP-hydrolysing)